MQHCLFKSDHLPSSFALGRLYFWSVLSTVPSSYPVHPAIERNNTLVVFLVLAHESRLHVHAHVYVVV